MRDLLAAVGRGGPPGITGPAAVPGNRRSISKKLRNHQAATALHFAHYNLVRRHQTLRVTPAMEAGVTSEVWSMDQLLDAALAEAA